MHNTKTSNPPNIFQKLAPLLKPIQPPLLALYTNRQGIWEK